MACEFSFVYVGYYAYLITKIRPNKKTTPFPIFRTMTMTVTVTDNDYSNDHGPCAMQLHGMDHEPNANAK